MKRLLMLGLMFLSSAASGMIAKLNTSTTFYCVMIDSITSVEGMTSIGKPTTVYKSVLGAAGAQITDFTWAEVDSTNMKGLYAVGLTPTTLNTIGEYVISITSPTCIAFRKSIDVLSKLPSDSVDATYIASATVVNAVNVSSQQVTNQIALSSNSVVNQVNQSTGTAVPYIVATINSDIGVSSMAIVNMVNQSSTSGTAFINGLINTSSTTILDQVVKTSAPVVAYIVNQVNQSSGPSTAFMNGLINTSSASIVNAVNTSTPSAVNFIALKVDTSSSAVIVEVKKSSEALAGGAISIAEVRNAVNVSSSSTVGKIALLIAESSGAIKNEVNQSTIGVTVATNGDKTGYTISGTKQTLDALNDITAANVWSATTRALTDKYGFGVDQGTVTVQNNKDKTGYTASTVSDKAGYSISGTKQTLDAMNDITAANVWASATRSLTEQVTAYTLVNNQDKNGYTVDNATVTKMTGASLNDIWNYNIDGKDNNSSGFYVVKGTNTGSSTSSGATAQQVWEYATRALTDKTGFSSGLSQTEITMISTTTSVGVWTASTATYVTDGTMGKKINDIPLSGTGDWSSLEKALIKQSLAVYSTSNPVTNEDILRTIKKQR